MEKIKLDPAVLGFFVCVITNNGVSETTWNRWEKGAKAIPADVLQHIQSVLKQRKDLMLSMINNLGNMDLEWISEAETLEQYITRSVAAEYIALLYATDEKNG